MELEKKLHKLEVANRVLFGLLFFVVLAAATSYVYAAGEKPEVSADSVTAHALYVVRPSYGKQGVKIIAHKNGSVTFTMVGYHGEGLIRMEVNAAGKPTLCLSDGKVCRVSAGYIRVRKMTSGKSGYTYTFALRDTKGHVIWTPKVKS